jgi:hypothetical protein
MAIDEFGIDLKIEDFVIDLRFSTLYSVIVRLCGYINQTMAFIKNFAIESIW